MFTSAQFVWPFNFIPFLAFTIFGCCGGRRNGIGMSTAVAYLREVHGTVGTHGTHLLAPQVITNKLANFALRFISVNSFTNLILGGFFCILSPPAQIFWIRPWGIPYFVQSFFLSVSSLGCVRIDGQ